MNKKKRQKAIDALLATIVADGLKVQTGMVLMEVGTRMGRIERKVDAIMDHLGIDKTPNVEVGGTIMSSKMEGGNEK